MTPVVETERLILRGRTLADFPAYLELWNDPAVHSRLSDAPPSREEIWAKFARQAGLWALCGYGFFLAVEKASGSLIGEVGCARFERDIEPALPAGPEFGWAFLGRVHGRGFATEAVIAALAWADGQFPGAFFSCIINPDNAPSIRVAERCGFRMERRADYKGKPILVFHRETEPEGAR